MRTVDFPTHKGHPKVARLLRDAETQQGIKIMEQTSNKSESVAQGGLWMCIAIIRLTLSAFAKTCLLWKRQWVDLRAAYLDLGRGALASGQFRDQCAAIHASIDHLDARIGEALSANEVGAARGLAEKITHVPNSARRSVSTWFLIRRRNACMRTLGRQIENLAPQVGVLEYERRQLMTAQECIQALRAELAARNKTLRSLGHSVCHKCVAGLCALAKHMNPRCVLGFHRWDSCTCTKCGKTRDQDHDWSKDCERCGRCGTTRKNAHQWNGCKCKTCGSIRDQDHNWTKDCKRCSTCGATREDVHDWTKNCERCSRCGVARTAAHKWDGCRCEVCGTTRDQDHAWDACKCSRCGQTREGDHPDHDWSADCNTCAQCDARRSGAHDWKANCEHCGTCGATRKNAHDWKADCERCGTCGATRKDAHDWTEDCEKCGRCGAARSGVHEWDGCKCTVCGNTRDQEHNWDACKCSRCGKSQEVDHPDHDWTADCEQCNRCGAQQKARHQWDGCKCKACGATRDQDHACEADRCSRCGRIIDPRKSLEREEEKQFKRLAGLSMQSTTKELLAISRKPTTIVLDAFKELFEIYTQMLTLNPADEHALKQCYRLCCQWEPVAQQGTTRRTTCTVQQGAFGILP